jgi:hypothetical protein
MMTFRFMFLDRIEEKEVSAGVYACWDGGKLKLLTQDGRAIIICAPNDLDEDASDLEDVFFEAYREGGLMRVQLDGRDIWSCDREGFDAWSRRRGVGGHARRGLTDIGAFPTFGRPFDA